MVICDGVQICGTQSSNKDLSVKISPVVSDDISKVDILFLVTMVMFEGWLTCEDTILQ